MARRDFRTPPSLPIDTQTRCITIPASQQWLGLVNAALLMLTEAWRYEQVEETDLTPEAAAAAAYEMYVAYLGDCAMACCPMRVNPFTGRLQQSDDGGVTFYDVPDGPWTESLYPPFSSMPPAIDSPTPECQAAATAAYVLVNLYTQVGNTLLNAVAATDWEYAGALGSMLSGFLLTIGAAATQPYVAIASLLGIVGVKEQYVSYPLDADDQERLMCILLDNATLETSGAVTFGFQAVWDAIDLDSPKNGLVRFLLTMIGPDALNYSGSIDAGVPADCGACEGEWCRVWEFDVANDPLGWQANQASCAMANWLGYPDYFGAVNYCGGQPIVTRIRPTLAIGDVDTVLTHVEVYAWAGGALLGRPWELLTPDVNTAYVTQSGPSWQGGLLDTPITGPLVPVIGAVAYGGGWLNIAKVRLRGTGTPPSGGSNC